MKVYVKCFATLAQDDKCNYRQAEAMSVPAGMTIRNFVKLLGVAQEAVKIAFVNNRIAPMDQPLEDGDRVALAPAVGGM